MRQDGAIPLKHCLCKYRFAVNRLQRDVLGFANFQKLLHCTFTVSKNAGIIEVKKKSLGHTTISGNVSRRKGNRKNGQTVNIDPML